MTKQRVCANTPALSRRSFVAALAASLASATTAQADGAQAIAEHPELVAMSDQLPLVRQNFKDTETEIRSIVKQWQPQWPEPDPEIMYLGFLEPMDNLHRNILGAGISRPVRRTGENKVHYIKRVDDLLREYERHKKEAERTSTFKKKIQMERNLRLAKDSKAKIKPARSYWKEVNRIEKTSGIKCKTSDLI